MSMSTRHLPILISLACLAGCSGVKLPQANVSPAPVASAATTPSPAAAVSPAPQKGGSVASSSTATKKTGKSGQAPFNSQVIEWAADKAASAESIAQSAQSQEDWTLAAGRWQQAIELLKTVPTSHPKRSIARVRIADYQRKLANAQRIATGGTSTASDNQIAASSGQAITVDAVNSGGGVASEVALAKHLRKIGAKMYGAYWCSTCRWQEEQFGEAFSQINYIECDPAGANAQPSLCDRKGITAYPTWEFNGQLYRPGALSLEKLADLSGYPGARNFGS